MVDMCDLFILMAYPPTYPQLYYAENNDFLHFCVALSHGIPYSTNVAQIQPWLQRSA